MYSMYLGSLLFYNGKFLQNENWSYFFSLYVLQTLNTVLSKIIFVSNTVKLGYNEQLGIGQIRLL